MEAVKPGLRARKVEGPATGPELEGGATPANEIELRRPGALEIWESVFSGERGPCTTEILRFFSNSRRRSNKSPLAWVADLQWQCGISGGGSGAWVCGGVMRRVNQSEASSSLVVVQNQGQREVVSGHVGGD